MPPQPRSGLRDTLSRNVSLIFPVLVMGAILVMVVPLPPLLMDLLLAGNITLAVIILLTTIHVASPLEFSVFPSLLLGTTLMRLVLNVASTRLILTGATERGTAAAGNVIAAFGEFVTAGSPVVGLVIFLILVSIQFLVITKGATRIGEVAARFALDGMPGRQMAVDADLAAGLITKDEAREARRQITQQADFYGAMDGASKFIRGDAVAGVVITFVNIIGGLFIGIVMEGMSVADAATVFTTLTIGDGLVAQVPALLISIAAGLIVTRTSTHSDLSRDAVQQVFRHPATMYLAATFLIVLAFTGLPTGPLLALGSGCAAIGWILQSATVVEPVAAESPTTPPKSAPVQSKLRVQPIELELGIGLIRLADRTQESDLLERITALRNETAAELGFIVPKVHVRDNLQLDPRQFQIKLRGVPVFTGEAYADALLAVDAGKVEQVVDGIETNEPGTGASARWIQQGQRKAAVAAGYVVHRPQHFVVQHLREVVRSHAADLLTRQQVHGLLQELRQQSPQLVDELIPGVLSTSLVHQVLELLLEERVPIRDLETIIEALSVHGERTKNARSLTEHVRQVLGRSICHGCRDHDGLLHCLTAEPDLEDDIAASLPSVDTDVCSHVALSVQDTLNRSLTELLPRLTAAGRTPVLLCRAETRWPIRRLTERTHPALRVISRDEMTNDTQPVTHGVIRTAIWNDQASVESAAPQADHRVLLGALAS